jgi:MFS family permease
VQWVSVLSAVQELTESDYQARVVGLLEAVGKAMPGVGFLLGGAIAQLLSPRASFLMAGLGVIVVLALVTPALARTRWAEPVGELPPDQPGPPQPASVGPAP